MSTEPETSVDKQRGSWRTAERRSLRATGALNRGVRRGIPKDGIAGVEQMADRRDAGRAFWILGIPEESGEDMLSPDAGRLHTALASSLALLLSSDEQSRAMMLSVEELLERIETPEVAGRWEG